MITFGGLAVLGVVMLPRLLSGRPLSYPIIYIACGALVMLIPVDFGSPDPLRYPDITERLAEMGVIIALTGAGLKLNRRPGLRSWITTWRLLALTMPLTIGVMAFLAIWLLDLSVPAAVLLAAALAPTDPVLAADVQVEAPATSGEESEDHEVPFALTSEAGLNDGLAFPFTNAAIAMAIAGSDPGGWALEWFAVDVVFRIACGLLIGYVLGRGLGHMVFERPEGRPLAETSEGMVVIATTLLVYGATELVGGYGFLAVFVAAVSMRGREQHHEYHHVLHGFSDQAERILSAVILLALGAAVSQGLLSEISLGAVVCAVLLIFVVRPATGFIAQLGCRTPSSEKWTIAFFGIRGIGSIYYLAHGLNEAPFGAEADTLWSVVGLTILLSVLVHGVTASGIMRRVVHDEN